MRKLIFNNTRRKLFSEEGGLVFRDLICKDCGQVLHTAESPSSVFCPNCGGRRMDIKLFDRPEEEKKFSRLSLFSSHIDKYESNLKMFSGKSLGMSEFEKTFSDKSEEMFEKGFAEKVGDSVNISKDAFELQRLFSKLTISITKTMELDPSIMNGSMEKEDVINELENNHELPRKGIVIIKKAHGICPVENRVFSEEDNSWVEDSSIIPDLELEYNNQSFSLSQFMKIVKNRYPDAPENIIDILIDNGVIVVEGSQVTIHKK